ncbi:MAG: FKBP-type peptidyl-prolyl cis-trans isomerase [Salibacteraceae bacterium]
MLNRIVQIGVGVLLLLLVACESAPPPKKVPPKEDLIQYNQQMAKKEGHQIEKYIERRGWDMTAPGTGLYYRIYQRGQGTETAKAGQHALVNFKVSLLDGSVVYSSKEKGAQEFLIERDDVESGLHEGIKYMHIGDKATLILPSHRAHGLLGDRNKIPPRSTVIYDLELLELR